MRTLPTKVGVAGPAQSLFRRYTSLFFIASRAELFSRKYWLKPTEAARLPYVAGDRFWPFSALRDRQQSARSGRSGRTRSRLKTAIQSDTSAVRAKFLYLIPILALLLKGIGRPLAGHSMKCWRQWVLLITGGFQLTSMMPCLPQ